jgi:lysophospholipase L1-like esterase
VGTNNIGLNTPAEIADGVRATLDLIKERHQKAKILLLDVLPRGEKADSADRAAVKALNTELHRIGGVEHLDLGPGLLQPDGSISPSIMGDFLHPTADGYRIMARGIDAALKRMMN